MQCTATSIKLSSKQTMTIHKKKNRKRKEGTPLQKNKQEKKRRTTFAAKKKKRKKRRNTFAASISSSQKPPILSCAAPAMKRLFVKYIFSNILHIVDFLPKIYFHPHRGFQQPFGFDGYIATQSSYLFLKISLFLCLCHCQHMPRRC